MALIVFLRGVNVGGYRIFRPSSLARDLAAYDVVNIGAAGTFVVRKPESRAKFLAGMREKLPFETEVAFCNASEILRLKTEDPFEAEQSDRNVVRFVSILSKPSPTEISFPVVLPAGGEWLVRLIGARNRLVFGMYRRHMKTIGYLGQIEKIFGVSATTRNWNTIRSVLRTLEDAKTAGAASARNVKRTCGASSSSTRGRRT